MDKLNNSRRCVLVRSFAVIACGSIVPSAYSQVIKSNIKIVQVVPFSGPPGPVGRGLNEGAQAYFNYINDRGGIKGMKIDLVTEEDPRQTLKSVAVLTSLINKHRPSAVLHVMNADFNNTLIKEGLLEKNAIPVIGAWTGSTETRSKKYPYLFFTRIGLRQEVERMLRQVSSVGINKIGVVYQNDPFGKDAVKEIEAQAGLMGLKLLASESYERLPSDSTPEQIVASVKNAATKLSQTQVQCALHFGSAPQCAAFLKLFQQMGGKGVLVITNSGVDPDIVVSQVGIEVARGLGIVMAFPSTSGRLSVVAREYLNLMRRYGPKDWKPSNFSIEGFINAKILVEALYRSSNPMNSQSVYEALGKMRGVDIGDFLIDFSNGNREGSLFGDIAVIGANGKLLN